MLRFLSRSAPGFADVVFLTTNNCLGCALMVVEKIQREYYLESPCTEFTLIFGRR